MKKNEDPGMRSRARVHGDLRGNAQFRVFSDPGDPGVYGPGRLVFTVPVEAGLHGEFDHSDHPVERLPKPHVLHRGLEIHQAVLKRERPGQCRGFQNIVLALLGGEFQAESPRDCQGP